MSLAIDVARLGVPIQEDGNDQRSWSLFDRLWPSSTLHVVVRKEPFEEVGRLAYATRGQASVTYAVRSVHLTRSLFDRLWPSSTLHVVVRKEPFEEVGRLAYATRGQASVTYAVRSVHLTR
ncbi:hypothetical protein T265_12638, partial [Opisthorchis viverrini]